MQKTSINLLPQGDWPLEDLENVDACPLCGASQRRLLHEGLADRTFFTAPGQWSLWRCASCGVGYLDPRPDRTSIARAYGSYYTHSDVLSEVPRLSRLGRLRFALSNGYRKERYGAPCEPALRLGAVLATLLPPLRRRIDVAYRFLPRTTKNQPLRVLDVGCGNGAFLDLARTIGWKVAGAEPDPAARRIAADRGIEVRENAADWEDCSFDAVTLNHVIEHVYDPVELLRTSLRLLRPGGLLFVETPNIDAMGHAVYGEFWRGLEPPRHLILFGWNSLNEAVRTAGFTDIRRRDGGSIFTALNEQSRRMAAGFGPYEEGVDSQLPSRPGRLTRIMAAIDSRRSEFLTLTGRKQL